MEVEPTKRIFKKKKLEEEEEVFVGKKTKMQSSYIFLKRKLFTFFFGKKTKMQSSDMAWASCCPNCDLMVLEQRAMDFYESSTSLSGTLPRSTHRGRK